MVARQESEQPVEPQVQTEQSALRPASSDLADRFDAVVEAVDRWRDRPLLAVALAMVTIAIAAVGWWSGRSGDLAPIEAGIPIVSSTTSTAPGAASGAGGERAPLVVHVAGEVAKPGIVSLPAGSRVVDAVDAAGGPTPAADLDQLNLAAELHDGAQVRVPAEGEVASSPFGLVGELGGVDAPINVNQASATQLEGLPGIGPALAAGIVQWREEHGSFGSLDDLLQVPGIGPAKLEGLAEHATL